MKRWFVGRQLSRIPAGKKWEGKVTANQEKFYIIKTGIADIELNDQKTQFNRGSVVCVLPVVYYKIIGKGKHYLFFGSRSLKNDVKRLLCVVLKKQKQCCTWCWEFCCSPHVVLRFQVPLLGTAK